MSRSWYVVDTNQKTSPSDLKPSTCYYSSITDNNHFNKSCSIEPIISPTTRFFTLSVSFQLDTPFLAGDQLTMADVIAFPNFAIYARFGLDYEKNYPHLAKYYKQMAAVPSVEKTWPPHWKTGECPKKIFSDLWTKMAFQRLGRLGRTLVAIYNNELIVLFVPELHLIISYWWNFRSLSLCHLLLCKLLCWMILILFYWLE